MASLTAHRYTLRPYTGPKSRTTCPACGKPRCFTGYLDTDTGELLPDGYGRCDHEVSCAYHRNPYHREAGGLSYAAAIEGNERPPASPAPTHRAPAAQMLATVVHIPSDVFTASLSHYGRNALALLLRQHFGRGVADELLHRFRLGTSAHWPGACVFWFVDEQDRVRGGEVVLYDETGHSVKVPDRHITWVHKALANACQRRGEAPPAWLADYEARGQKSPCLFGLPQLVNAPAEQPVALVESAKTAMLATPYFPRYVWLATRGLSSLTPNRLEPLRGRRLVLFPDAGALGAWQTKAGQLRRLGFDVRVSDELETLLAEGSVRPGSDLADILLDEWAGYPPSWDK